MSNLRKKININEAGAEIFTTTNRGKVDIYDSIPAGNNVIGKAKITDGTNVANVDPANTARTTATVVQAVQSVDSTGKTSPAGDTLANAPYAKSTLYDSLGAELFTSANKAKVELEDDYGFGVEFTPTDEMRVITPVRLVGATFSGSTLDTNFWTSSLGTGGVATVANAQLVLSTGTTANNTTSIQSVRSARYVGGSALRYRSVIRFPDTGTTNNTRRWGAFTSTDGCFFELSGSTLKVVTRKTSSDLPVSSGSFNGAYGASFSINTSVHTYEIYWTNSKVYFIVDGEILHLVSATGATWSDTLHLPIRIENNNAGGSTSNVSFNIRTMSIHRLGSLSTAPISKYQSGTTAGLVFKYGPGNLHGLVISGVINNAVITLYDNTAASGTILWSSGAMGAQTTPFSLDFHDLPFSIGLTLVIASSNANCTIIYE